MLSTLSCFQRKRRRREVHVAVNCGSLKASACLTSPRRIWGPSREKKKGDHLSAGWPKCRRTQCQCISIVDDTTGIFPHPLSHRNLTGGQPSGYPSPSPEGNCCFFLELEDQIRYHLDPNGHPLIMRYPHKERSFTGRIYHNKANLMGRSRSLLPH